MRLNTAEALLKLKQAVKNWRMAVLNSGMDGTVGVRSSGVPGEGSEFYFILPARLKKEKEPEID